jgi:nitrogenase molybdenum-iron protein alpha/beta subunit
MPECDNPLWPCAMTGAAACLAGFFGISVVIHGSSGCYFYPSTLLHTPLHGTFILEKEVVFGSEDRLSEVIGSLAGSGNRIAVITTCVPAILGEDVRAMLAGYDVLLVDSPGFSGDVETGYARALTLLDPRVDPLVPGVNIGGSCLLDPFSRGNVQEICRLLRLVAVPVGTVFADDTVARVSHAASYTLGTNDDFYCPVGERLGGTLGLMDLRVSFEKIGDTFPDCDITPVISEIDYQEERLIHACDKYLQRFDPPSVAIFAGASYAEYAAATLEQYLDADICCIGLRNHGNILHPSEYIGGLNAVRDMITAHDPDLVLGSSFERSVSKKRGFFGIIPPLRGEVRLAPRPLAGIHGTLSFVEDVLNTCMDKKHRSSS